MTARPPALDLSAGPDDWPAFNFYPVTKAALDRLAKEAPDARQRDLYRKVEEIDDEEFERGITPFTGVTRYVGKIARPDVVNLPIYGPGWALLVALPKTLEPLITSASEERKNLRQTARQDILRNFHLRVEPLADSIMGRVKATEFRDALVPRIRLAERHLVEVAFDFWFAVDSDGLRADGHIVIDPTPDDDPLQGPRKALYGAVYDYVRLRLLYEEIGVVLAKALSALLGLGDEITPEEMDVQPIELDSAGIRAITAALELFKLNPQSKSMEDLMKDWDNSDDIEIRNMTTPSAMRKEIGRFETARKVDKSVWQGLKGREKLAGRLAALAENLGWPGPLMENSQE